MVFDIEMIKKVYQKIAEKVEQARALNGRPLTLSEKILYSHLFEKSAVKSSQEEIPMLDFAPDRIALSGCYGPNGLCSQFMQAGKEQGCSPDYRSL